MKKFTFLILCLFLFFINTQDITYLDIKEGINSYKLTKEMTFKLTAKDEGFYLIAFSDLVRVTQANGNLGENVDFKNGNYTTIAYSQHFKKGNCLQFIYPARDLSSNMNYLIKIVKFS